MTDWSRIVEQHGPAVWRTAYRLLNNEADASDCYQRAFLSALELSRTEAIRNWPALLRRLATARALEQIRQRYRERNRFSLLPEEGAVDDKALDPHTAAEAGELAEHLRVALAELDVSQAQVFCLACLEGYSYEQIADLIGLTVNHVGVLLNRARKKLRERLQSHRPASAAQSIAKEQ